MALPESPISVLCKHMLNFVRGGLNAAANNIVLSMGAPAEADIPNEQHCINLFFYRFEPGGFQSHAYPNEPWWLRMYCLVTIFGVEEDEVSAGENELRILGEVMRLFRETPVSDPVNVGGEELRLQTVFSPATDEQFNQIWSTQGETAFRPSLIYEMALAPVMPAELRSKPPLVGAIGAELRADPAGRHAAFSGALHASAVPLSRIDIANPLWAPAMCWLHAGECEQALALDVDSLGAGPIELQLWLAGDPAEEVELLWQRWDKAGWQDVEPPIQAHPAGTELDPANVPENAPGVFPFVLTLPVSIPAGESAAQALLYARRSVQLNPGSGAVTVRSNPLLISLYRVSP